MRPALGLLLVACGAGGLAPLLGAADPARQKSEGQKPWAFSAPVRPAVPHVASAAWVRNPIGAFIGARLAAKGLRPSPEADRRTLLRRVTFDLTGLPPTPA